MVNQGKPSSLDQVILQLVRTRLFLPLLILFLVAICGAAFYSIQSLEKQNQENVHILARSVDQYIDQSERTLDTIARVAEVSPREQTAITMKGIWESYRYFDTLYYVDEDYIIQEMVPSQSRYLGLDMSHVPYFNWTESPKRLSISRPFNSLRTQTPTVYLIQQLSNGGAIVGELNLGTLRQVTKGAGKPEGEFAFILDQSGTVLTYPSDDLVRQQANLGNLEIFKRALTGDATLVYLYADQWVVASATRIDRTGWVIVDQIPLKTILDPYATALVLVCFFSLILWIALVMNLKKDLKRRIIAPLLELSRNTASLAEGDYSSGRTEGAIHAAFFELRQLGRSFWDMSDAIQARESVLLEHEEMFKAVTECANVSVCLVQDEKIIYTNPYTSQITGYSPEEMKGHPYIEYIHPESHALVYAQRQEQENGKPVLPTEIRVCTKSGEERWVENSAALLTYHGKPTYITIAIDSTDRKKTHENLDESVAGYKTLFENSGTAMMLIGEDSSVLRINRKFEELSGYSHADIEGKKKWTEFVATDADMFRMQGYRRLRMIDPTSAPSQFEFAFAGANNRQRDCIAIVSVIPGTKKNLVALLDITEQKLVELALTNSENQYRTLFETATIAIFLREENRIIDCNPETLRLFKIDDAQDFIGHSPLDFSPAFQPDGRSSVDADREYVTAAMEGRPQRFFWNHLSKDGTPFDMELSLNRVTLGQRKILIAFGSDITRRLEAEREIKEKNTEIHGAYEQLAATEEELRSNYNELFTREQELQASEQKNAILIGAIPDMMFVLTDDGVYVEFHIPDEKYLALPVEQIIGKNIYDTGVKKEHADEIMNYVRQAIRTSRLVQFEYELTVPAGKRSYEARMMVLHDREVLAIVRDITERKLAEQEIQEKNTEIHGAYEQLAATEEELRSNYNELFTREQELRASEQKNAILIGAIPDMMFVITDGGVYVEFHIPDEKYLALPVEQIIGKNIYDTGVKKEHADEIMNHVRQAIRTSRLVQFEYELTVPAGKRSYEARMMVLHDREVLAIVRDITERKLAEQEIQEKNTEIHGAYEQLAATEEELRSNYNELHERELELQASEQKNAILIGAIPDMMFVITYDGIYRDFHIPDAKYLALPVEQIIGKNIYDTGVEKESADLIMNYVRESIRSSRFVQFEYELIVPAGKRSYEARMMALHDREALAIVRDITERKMGELALSQATKKLNLLNHITLNDIQNGIFSLSGYLELEEDLLSDDTLKQYHEKEVTILQIISDALLFARHYQNLGLQSPHWQSVVHSFLMGISHMNISHIKRNIHVENLELYADTLLEKVFFILAENVKHHAKKATEITLRYEERKRGLILIFEDNGPGIPDNLKKTLFERDHIRKKGMGLFLAKEILEITGITIEETGTYGTGARFDMFVPAEGFRFIQNQDE